MKIITNMMIKQPFGNMKTVYRSISDYHAFDTAKIQDLGSLHIK